MDKKNSEKSKAGTHGGRFKKAYELKFHTKYLTHTLKDTIFIQRLNFKSSEVFLKRPPDSSMTKQPMGKLLFMSIGLVVKLGQ